MKKTQHHGIDFWQFENLSGEQSIKHYVTTRRIASTEKEFTLSYSSSPDRAEIQQNRAILASIFGITEERLYFPVQVHQTRIATVTGKTLSSDLSDTDALITHEKNICLAVMSADCVPILLYDKKNNAIGAVHSGWRGTTAKILEKTLHEMNQQFGTIGEHIVAGIGPSVSQEFYEVGNEVIEEVTRAFGDENKLIIPKPNNKANLDLWLANRMQLLAFGVPDHQIETSNLCTVKNNNYFFSARKGDGGRFAATIMLE
jgi:polyphenol oxidase